MAAGPWRCQLQVFKDGLIKNITPYDKALYIVGLILVLSVFSLTQLGEVNTDRPTVQHNRHIIMVIDDATVKAEVLEIIPLPAVLLKWVTDEKYSIT